MATGQSIWWHYLCITIPDVITKPDVGFLLIDGGNNTDVLPKPTDNFVELTSMFAVSTGTIGIDLQQISNWPLIFKNDPSQQRRNDDNSVAWTWKSFIENISDPNIVLFLPMTKAAVRAMDAVTEITKNKGVADIKKFIVAGASKRGWAAWTTIAVDKRAFAAVPIVMDLFSMNSNLHHQYKSLGGWTFAFSDYYYLNVTAHLDTPEFSALQRIIDPIYYLDRYENIKLLLINSAGDEFFLPDDSDYFWTELRAVTNGTVMVRRLPNAEHSCVGHEISILLNMRSFFLSVYNEQKLPIVIWTRPNNETHGITIVTVDTSNGPTPFDVTVFYAQTLDNKRRDFRLIIGNPNNPGKILPHPVIWHSDKTIIQTETTSTSIKYTVAFPKPISGWFGFFFQLSFGGLDDSTLQISSEVNIIPETYPFVDCYKETCRGSLV